MEKENERVNITDEELEGFQELAFDYLRLTDLQLNHVIGKRELLEVHYDHKA